MNANTSGRAVEDTLAGVFTATNIKFDRQVEVGTSIYETMIRVDFVLRNLAKYPRGLIVESRWQDVAGSADEKFPYLVANIRQCYPLPTIIVAHGHGARPGALAWLCASVDGTQLVAVYGLEDFLSWALREDKL